MPCCLHHASAPPNIDVLLRTAQIVDDIGTIHVNWENGRRLGVCPDVDSIRKVQEVPEKKPSVAEKLKAAEKQAASTPKADKPAPNKSNQER